jgi:uroporphyrinogen decarboxylase
MLDLIRTPDLAAEVTLQPIEAFGFDAAIIFSDILPPLVGMGFELDFIRGVGPRISNRIERTYDVDVLGTPPAAETMAGTLEAIRIVTRELGRGVRDRFCGAPSPRQPRDEGGATKDFARTKAFMLSGAGGMAA